jgi:hypothetical protein
VAFLERTFKFLLELDNWGIIVDFSSCEDTTICVVVVAVVLIVVDLQLFINIFGSKLLLLHESNQFESNESMSIGKSG